MVAQLYLLVFSPPGEPTVRADEVISAPTDADALIGAFSYERTPQVPLRCLTHLNGSPDESRRVIAEFRHHHENLSSDLRPSQPDSPLTHG